MVEGPLVSLISERMARFKNKKLVSADIVGGRYIDTPPEGWREFSGSLPLKLVDVIKKGKVIFLFFDGWVMIVRFGMTGWFYFGVNSKDEDIILNFQDGRKVVFFDQRRFGTITLTKDYDYVFQEIERIAPDIMDDSVSFSDISERIPGLNPNFSISKVLMDQKLLFSGVGNIIKSELLYDSKISPFRKTKDIKNTEWEKIFNSARKNSKKMIGNNEYNVYQKKVDPYGNSVEKVQSEDKRTTFWVPGVQK
jgi:formamidopyrimidine-DNA glycosylase